MAKKPRSQWSPAYRKRILAVERKARREGRKPTQQEKRGHKPLEHVQRHEGEAARIAALGGLTSRQRDAVRAFAREQKTKIKQYKDADRDVLVAPMLAWAARVGYEAFAEKRGMQRGARRQFNMEVAEGSYESRGGAYLDVLGDGLPDSRWMYYHT